MNDILLEGDTNGAPVDPSTSETDTFLTSNVFDLLSLNERVVVITGGARGIGLALAFAVAEAGAKVAIVDAASAPDSNYMKLKDICSEPRYYQSDVTNYKALENAFNEIVRDFGYINGLITAAGICPDQPFLERDPNSVKKSRQMTRQPDISERSGAGAIVTIASMAAHRASKDQYTSDYCMSKGAVLSLTKQLGVELANRRIRVNAISPGYVSTDLMDDLIRARPKLGEVFNSEPPLKRMADRSDLKGAAVYLLSDASAYMTSGELLITGGLHAGQVH